MTGTSASPRSPVDEGEQSRNATWECCMSRYNSSSCLSALHRGSERDRQIVELYMNSPFHRARSSRPYMTSTFLVSKGSSSGTRRQPNMATPVDRARACEILGYDFVDESILTEALRSAHRIEFGNGTYQSLENNRRLAAVGQAVINLQLTERWINGLEPLCTTARAYPYQTLIVTGKLADAQVQSASNLALSTITMQSGINSCIIESDRQRDLTVLPQSTLATALKAVIGAVWRDSHGNNEIVRRVLCRLQ